MASMNEDSLVVGFPIVDGCTQLLGGRPDMLPGGCLIPQRTTSLTFMTKEENVSSELLEGKW